MRCPNVLGYEVEKFGLQSVINYAAFGPNLL